MVYELQRLRRLHILLVDDDPGAYNRIQQAIGSDFHLYHAQSLIQARQHLIEYIPDIVICEVQLGKESGLELMPLYSQHSYFSSSPDYVTYLTYNSPG